MDVFEASARILSLAACGASHAEIMAMHQHLRQDDMRWLLNMERILQAQKSLV